ncbi:MAG: hypothetical protein RIT81_30925 [Deltaproteobacteria bacterium]
MIACVVGLLASAPVGILPVELEGLESPDRSYLLAEVAEHVERITKSKPIIGDFAASPAELSASTGVERVIGVSMVKGAALVRISLQLHEPSGARRALQFDGAGDREVWGAALPGLVEALLLDRGPAVAAAVVQSAPEPPPESTALWWGGVALGATGLAVGTTLRILASNKDGRAEELREQQLEATSRPEWEMLDEARETASISGARLGTASDVTLIISSAITGAALAALVSAW